MTPERWQKIDGLLQGALERVPEERDAFLASACDDDELRREVASLLSFHDRSESFIETPPYKAAAELFSGDQTESLVGRVVGVYRVERELGRGGMGVVYLARDTRLDRPVALKLLPALYTTDAERVRRFQQEARAASALNHPGILTIFEVGEVEGLRFIATEYVEGETLRELSEGGGLELGRALDVAIQTAGALAAAHAAGIVHRDVKPENVMVRPDGYVKVLDFGLAKLTQKHESQSGDSAAASLHTTPGVLLGTVSFMSPEQARGREVDARTDVWSLGVVLYQMTTGRLPFDGETPSDTIALILQNDPPPLATYAPDAPEKLQRIVAKALSKKREERYQSIALMHADLEDLRRDAELRAGQGRSHSSSTGAGASLPAQTSRTNDSERATGVRPAAAETEKTARTPDSRARRAASFVGRHGGAAPLVAAPLVAAACAALLFSASLISAPSLLLVAVACAALSAYYFLFRAPRTDSVAVLPFEHATVAPSSPTGSDFDHDYLSDGLTESIIQSLSQLPTLKVIARSSVFRYKGKEIDPREVGRALNVRTIVTGKITQRGETLTISAELVDVRDSTTMWSERYDTQMGDLSAVQTEMASRISKQLGVRLTGEERRRLAKQYTTDADAHRLYLKGRYYLSQFSEGDFKRALNSFKQAIDLDPNYALAYAGMADAYYFLSDIFLPPQEAMPKSRAAALKALELDEMLAEAHTSLAVVKSYYDWEWATAEREYRRAIELNPGNATAHHLYGLYLMKNMGRPDEALAELRRARELDPLSPSIAVTAAAPYCFAPPGKRDPARALEEGRRIIITEQDFMPAHALLAMSYLLLGRFDEAIAEWKKAEAIEPMSELLAYTGYVYAVAGRQGEARQVLAELQRRARHEHVQACGMAMVHAGLGEKDQAFAWLDKAFEAREEHLPGIKVLPPLDSLRSDPRFTELLRRVGLEP